MRSGGWRICFIGWDMAVRRCRWKGRDGWRIWWSDWRGRWIGIRARI